MNNKISKANTLGVRDVAHTLGVSEAYVRYLTDTGRLACTREKSGRRRFQLKDVMAYDKLRQRKLRKKFKQPLLTSAQSGWR